MSLTKDRKQKLNKNDFRLDGVVIGVLVGISDKDELLVVYPSNPNETALKAKTTVSLGNDDIGKEVALMFEGGNPKLPLIIGRIQNPHEVKEHVKSEKEEVIGVDVDDEHIMISGKQSIRLKCGKASITLTKEGKILVRGTYILNRSSGANRIKGGSVQIN